MWRKLLALFNAAGAERNLRSGADLSREDGGPLDSEQRWCDVSKKVSIEKLWVFSISLETGRQRHHAG